MLFASLFVVLVVLYHVSIVNHGLGESATGYHYYWTYGPTLGEIRSGYVMTEITNVDSADYGASIMDEGGLLVQNPYAMAGDEARFCECEKQPASRLRLPEYIQCRLRRGQK